MRVVICVLIAATGCKKPAASRDFFGTKVMPPMGLDHVRPGMTQAEALAAVPRLKKAAGGLELPTGVKDVELHVQGDPVTRIYAHVTSPMLGGLRAHLMDDWKTEATPDHYRGDAWIANLASYGDAIDIVWWPKLDVKATFAGGPATLPAPLAKVKPGMMTHEIEGIVPPFVAKQKTLPEEEIRISYTGEDKPGGLTSVSVYLDPDLRDELLALWGPGELGKSDDLEAKETRTWFAPAAGWRATLTLARKGEVNAGIRAEDWLRYERYVTLAAALGDGPQLAMVASAPWGKKLEAVATEFPAMSSNTLALLPTEDGPRTGFFILDADAKIDTLVVRFNCGAKCDAVAAAFATKWGEPKGEIYHATEPFARVRKEGPELVLTYRPTPPPKTSTVY